MGVVRRDDAGLRMIQAALGDVRTDAKLGEPRAHGAPQIVQAERTYLVFGESI